jgi:Asp-tRNA(Asn)/Glu-tRNA(Gln) amidotransferase A subunit family amidase
MTYGGLLKSRPEETHWLTAFDALELFRSRDLSPVELMEAVIARAEEVEPKINAFGVTLFDQAIEQARRAEARYAGRGPTPRPLEGIPVAVKEETPVRGQPCTQGSLIYQDWIADFTAVCVDRILKAGGIIHARSTAPEFSCAAFTHSRLWGLTRNPWNLDYSPGGSSGGSGASLAAGSTTLANGSDIGGSIRIPAASCGVVGFKPPYGRVPEFAPFNLDHYCHEGPMARTVRDCALLENVMAGPDPSDAASLRPKLRVPLETGGIDGWRIALSVDLGGYPVDRDVENNLLGAAEAFREAGATVEQVHLQWHQREIVEAARIHYGLIFGPYVRREVEEHPDLVTTYAAKYAEDVAPVQGDDYLRGLEIEGRVYEALGNILTRYRVLICPTLSIPAFEAGDDYVLHGPEVNGEQQDSVEDVLMTIPFNICSRCPVMSVPSGFDRHGVPTGLQIVGRTYDDISVFRAASAFEKLRPWLDSPARRPRIAE